MKWGIASVLAFSLAAFVVAGCGDDPASSTGRTGLRSLAIEYAAVETLTVPVNGSAVLSTTVLETGVTYRLRASGTAFIGLSPDTTGDGLADAEYADFSGVPGSLLDACGPDSAWVDLGLAVNDATVDSLRFPDWGAFDPTHVYTVEFVGTGAPVSVNYHDCDYTDNAGSLKVEILAPVPPLVIDVKPGSLKNPVNLGSKGVIPVAILGSEDFDVTLVDVASLAFGPGGAGEAHGMGHFEDVNDDGIMDLMLHFRTQASGLAEGMTEICLRAVVDGLQQEGCDTITIVPPDKD